jgi:hypothetical protein
VNQVVVAEAEAALADHDLLVAGRARLVDDVAISQATGTALLDVDGLALRQTLRMKFVWRQRNAGVCRTSTTAAPRPSACPRARRSAPARRAAGCTSRGCAAPRSMPGLESSCGRAVRLVVGRLEDERDAEPLVSSLQLPASR